VECLLSTLDAALLRGAKEQKALNINIKIFAEDVARKTIVP
jgi:hypothetical protein